MTRTIPILPCPRIDDVIAFYGMLGFAQRYRQVRPNPYTVVTRGGIELHFCGIDDFDPRQSTGSCIVQVEDVDALYRAFAGSLRDALGRLPVSGIPRLTRPRMKEGAVRGFTMVDPGGNFIRVYGQPETKRPDGGDASHDTHDTHATRDTAGPLARALDAAALLGDSKGDAAAAANVLDLALARHASAPIRERAAALVYRAELAMALDDLPGAAARLDALHVLPLDAGDRQALAAPLDRASEMAREVADDSRTHRE